MNSDQPSQPLELPEPDSSVPDKKPTHRWWHYLILGLVTSMVLAMAGGWYWYNHQLAPVNSDETEQLITIESGSSVKNISDKLELTQLIRSSTVFDLYTRRENVRSQLKAGTYLLSPSQSTPEIVKKLVDGETATRTLTIIEGDTLGRIKQRLVAEGFSEKEISSIFDRNNYDSELFASLPDGVSIEGYVFPDTYKIGYLQPPQLFIELGITQMELQLTKELKSKFKQQGLDLHQALTLASIIEREASVDQMERRQIAQVFISRLDIGEPLGADITACYAAELAGLVDPGQKCDQVPLTIDSPYNTRLPKNTGLPPGPIGAPSQSALEAVANPTDTDYIFYFHGDNDQAYFSETYQQHLQKIDQFCKENCG